MKKLIIVVVLSLYGFLASAAEDGVSDSRINLGLTASEKALFVNNPHAIGVGDQLHPIL